MNSDTPQPGPPPASPSATPPRTSNLKGRWKRGPSAAIGAPAQRPTTPASCGEVTDITSARESLTGQHVKGYERPAAPVSAAVPTPMPVAPAAPASPSATTPLRNEAAAPRPPGPVTLTPRPGTFNPPPHRHSSQTSRPEARPPQSARPAPPPRPPQEARGGERENFVALKPDPANDPAPRRLRTEASRPVPVEEYSPSNFGRGPDKSLPTKHEAHTHKDRLPEKRESAPAPSGERPRPHASIPAKVSSSKEGKAKSGGIFGFIKKIFGDSKKESSKEKAPSRRGESEREDDDGDEESGEERRRRRSSSERHGEHRHRSHHRSERR